MLRRLEELFLLAVRLACNGLATALQRRSQAITND
jgi:hypothetical protein